MNVAHVIVNNLGGITSLVQNLIIDSGPNALPQELVILDPTDNINQKAIINDQLKNNSIFFRFNPLENWYFIYGRLAKILSNEKGVLVSNDQYDLIMLQAFNIPRKVVQLVHDPYNLGLSLKFHHVIDHFITHSIYVYEQLKSNLAHRVEDISFIPYGIPLRDKPVRLLKPDEPLTLLFLGRHDKAKGIYDLFDINQVLKNQGISVRWVILGRGPETTGLVNQWRKESNVQFLYPSNYDELVQVLDHADIFVFPTKFEGFPVSLLEAMSRGCVPVVTDLPGGIRELIVDGSNGYRCLINDNEAFAKTVAFLHCDRERLLSIQNNGLQLVYDCFNSANQAPIYQEVFNALALDEELPRHHEFKCKIGSRLDHNRIPNMLTLTTRKILKFLT